MSLLEVIILLVIAGICGGIAQSIVGFSGGGCFASIAVGFIGALLGNWIAKKMNLPDFFVVNIGGTDFPIVWSIIGAVLFTAVISLISGRRRV